jgi:hypothetical protein
LDKKDYCLKLNTIRVNQKWDLVTYSDIDWPGNPETSVGVTGFIIYLLGVASCWRSKGQKGVTLSSRKAAYASMSETVKEIRFICFF